MSATISREETLLMSFISLPIDGMARDAAIGHVFKRLDPVASTAAAATLDDAKAGTAFPAWPELGRVALLTASSRSMLSAITTLKSPQTAIAPISACMAAVKSGSGAPSALAARPRGRGGPRQGLSPMPPSRKRQ
jgi:hypothetical protein